MLYKDTVLYRFDHPRATTQKAEPVIVVKRKGHPFDYQVPELPTQAKKEDTPLKRKILTLG